MEVVRLFLHAVSLSEFGKHIPKEKHPNPDPQPPTTDPEPYPRLPDPQDMPGMQDLEELFSEEFAAEAEAQLDEAMQMFSTENPALWQQFEAFAKSMGLQEGSPFPPPSASQGESSADRTEGQAGEGGARGGSAADSSLDAKLGCKTTGSEETLWRLREGSQQIEVREVREGSQQIEVRGVREGSQQIEVRGVREGSQQIEVRGVREGSRLRYGE